MKPSIGFQLECDGKSAARAGVKNLVLTHDAPRMAPGQEADWTAQATAYFAGPVILGPDLTSIEI